MTTSSVRHRYAGRHGLSFLCVLLPNSVGQTVAACLYSLVTEETIICPQELSWEPQYGEVHCERPAIYTLMEYTIPKVRRASTDYLLHKAMNRCTVYTPSAAIMAIARRRQQRAIQHCTSVPHPSTCRCHGCGGILFDTVGQCLDASIQESILSMGKSKIAYTS
jgi:hypothetical protein